MEAAQFAEAANRQGQYTEMGDLLYERQSTWASLEDPTSVFEGFATELGLDLNQVRQDVADPDIAAGINEDLADATSLQLPGTPAFLLQGERTSPSSFSDLQSQIQAEIDAIDSVFRLNRDTGELTVADTDRFADADFPITVPVLVRDVEGNEQEIDVTIERNEI